MSGKKDPKIPLTTIAERGDLILHVGGTKDAKRQDVKKLLVSSAILIQLSKVFAAPLGPHFREGQASRSESDPQVIELPEDNANAIEDMCNLLHLNVVGDLSGPKAKSDAPRVLCLAVAIDKYDLVDVLRLQWLRLLHAISTEGPQLVAAAAYVLDQPDAFWAATRRWTMDGRHVSIHESLRDDKVCRYLPARIFDIVARKQLTIAQELAEGVLNLALWDCRFCRGGSDSGEQMLEICELLGLPHWPPTAWTARQAIENIRPLAGFTKSDRSGCHGAETVEWDEVSALIRKIEYEGAGFCLHCMREDRVDVQHCMDTAHKS